MSVEEKFRLGKKRGVVHDPRTLKLRAFLPRTLPTPPSESYVGKGEDIRYYGNDRYGDCTCAAHGHRIDVQERASRQEEVQLSTKDILQVYSAVTGFREDDPSTDNGAYCLDILNYMWRTGMGREADGTRHRIYAFASFNPSDHHLWRVASWMFGGVYYGAGLPLTAADQLDEAKEYWRVDDSDPDRAEVGSWGGHAMHAVGYSSGSIVLATWGRRLRATWDWVDRYVDEAYAVISEDFFRAGGKTPQGFNQTALEDALDRLR